MGDEDWPCEAREHLNSWMFFAMYETIKLENLLGRSLSITKSDIVCQKPIDTLGPGYAMLSMHFLAAV